MEIVENAIKPAFTEIFPNIFIGKFPKRVFPYKFDYYVELHENDVLCGVLDPQIYYSSDKADDKTIDWVMEKIKFIEINLKNNKTVLINYAHDFNRSIFIALSYLIVNGKTESEAIKLLSKVEDCPLNLLTPSARRIIRKIERKATLLNKRDLKGRILIKKQ